jgi:anti-anti-sigma factor
VDESVEAEYLSTPAPNGSTIDPLPVSVEVHLPERVVTLSGDLDLESRPATYHACAGGDAACVIVDMAELTFMDCSGYDGLVTARASLHRRGGSLTLRNQSGQPAYLLGLLAGLDPAVAATLDHVVRPRFVLAEAEAPVDPK